MQLTNSALLTATLLSATSSAFPQADIGDVDPNDLPQQCQQVCASVVTLTNDCDNQTQNDNDNRSCVCGANNAQNLVADCDACVSNYSNGIDNTDVQDIIRACSFTTRPFSSAQAQATSAPAVVASSSVANAVSSGVAVAPVPSTGATTNPTGAAVSSVVSRASSSAAMQQTGNAAADLSVGPVVGLAGLGLAVAGLLSPGACEV